MSEYYTGFKNQSFRSGDFAYAVIYYTRSIQLNPSAAAFNNRALMYIKLQKYDRALEDCKTVLSTDPGNLKGADKNRVFLGWL